MYGFFYVYFLLKWVKSIHFTRKVYNLVSDFQIGVNT